MKTLIIHTHPNPASFTTALKDTVVAAHREIGDEVIVKDLYAMGFDPVFRGEELGRVFSGQGSDADARAEQADLLAADHIVFLYPIWWLDRPAILKGYIDRVFVNGVAFRYGEKGATPLLTGKSAAVYQVTGTPQEVYRNTGLDEAIDKTMRIGLLGFTGITDVHLETHFGIAMKSDAERKAILENARTRILASAKREAA